MKNSECRVPVGENRRWWFQQVMMALAVWAMSLTEARAGEVDWWAMTGGGGISQHGTTAIGGAIGPIAPAASQAAGGTVVLIAGFWPVLNGHPKAASPVLQIAGGSEKVVLSWAVGLDGFVLEYTTDLNSGVWVIEPTAVVDTLTDHTVSVTPESGFRCYRLRGE